MRYKHTIQIQKHSHLYSSPILSFQYPSLFKENGDAPIQRQQLALPRVNELLIRTTFARDTQRCRRARKVFLLV